LRRAIVIFSIFRRAIDLSDAEGTRFVRAARELVRKDIERVVAEARDGGKALRAAQHAAQIAMAHPGACFLVAYILDEIEREAAKAGVPVEGLPQDG
jgi:hypothetical protein